MNPHHSKQTSQPLFPKVLWNRPLNRAGAGRLLLVGGHGQEFSHIQTVYQMALAVGVGECQVILPDSLQKLLTGAPDTSFVPSSPSGSLGKGALAEILQLATACDAIALGASLSGNSETAILIELLLSQYDGPIIVYDQALTLVKHNYRLIADRPNCLIVAPMQQIFKLAGGLGIGLKIEPQPGAVNKIEIMATIAAAGQASYLLAGHDLIAAAAGQLSLTSAADPIEVLEATVAVAAVFWLQNPTNRFAGLTTAAYVLGEARQALTDSPEKVLTTAEISRAISRVVDRY